jgi:hypothetical protein
MKTTPALEKMCFASCARVPRLLKILPEAARRAMTGEEFSAFPAGRNFSDDFTQATMNKLNLTRHEIFRGKISLRKNQTNQPDLEERTHSAPKK